MTVYRLVKIKCNKTHTGKYYVSAAKWGRHKACGGYTCGTYSNHSKPSRLPLTAHVRTNISIYLYLILGPKNWVWLSRGKAEWLAFDGRNCLKNVGVLILLSTATFMMHVFQWLLYWVHATAWFLVLKRQGEFLRKFVCNEFKMYRIGHLRTFLFRKNDKRTS